MHSRGDFETRALYIPSPRKKCDQHRYDRPPLRLFSVARRGLLGGRTPCGSSPRGVGWGSTATVCGGTGELTAVVVHPHGDTWTARRPGPRCEGYLAVLREVTFPWRSLHHHGRGTGAGASIVKACRLGGLDLRHVLSPPRRRDGTWRMSRGPGSTIRPPCPPAMASLSGARRRRGGASRGHASPSQPLYCRVGPSLPAARAGTRADVSGVRLPVSTSLRWRRERPCGGGEVLTAVPIRPGVRGRHR